VVEGPGSIILPGRRGVKGSPTGLEALPLPQRLQEEVRPGSIKGRMSQRSTINGHRTEGEGG
jgi:hypothetical protein